MTRPSEIRLREDELPGATSAEFEVGVALPELRFTITPDVIADYLAAVDADPALYVLDGRPVAPPNVLSVYLMPVLYRRYPPIQGIIQAEVAWRWHHPIYADEETDVVVTGSIVEREQRRGKWFVRWTAAFHRADGALLAEAANRFNLPE